MSNKTLEVGFKIVDETGDISSVRKLTKDLQEMGYAVKEIEQLHQSSEAHNQAAKSADNHRESLDKLERELGQSTDALAELERSTDEVGDSLNELAQDGDNASASMESLRAAYAQVVAGGAALALAAKGAMTFETAMAGVKKTVEASDEQIDKLADRIKELSVETAQSAEDVATIAALGGQLGVAYGDLEDFITLASKVGVAFNLSAEQAGESVAKLSNIYQIPISEIEQLMDVINTLGNNTAATEAQIVTAMQRIGGSARLFGLAADEAAALADAFIALGRPPEVAGTAISAMLRKLNSAQTQGKGFQEALGKMGISAKQLAADIRENPQQALTDLLTKISELDSQAQTDVLSKLFGDEHSATIAVLTGSLETYKKALEQVNDKTKAAGALNKEFSAQTATTESQINQAINAVNNLSSDIGDNLLPVINSMADATRDTALALSKFTEDYPLITKMVTGFVALKVATMGLSMATKKQVTVSGLMNAQMLQTGLNAAEAARNMNVATTATSAFNRSLKGLQGAFVGLGRVMMANPIIATITAVTALTTAIDKLTDNTHEWQQSLDDAFNSLVELQTKAAQGIELNTGDLAPFKEQMAEIDRQIEELTNKDTGVFDFAKDATPWLSSNNQQLIELLQKKDELKSYEAELHDRIKANAEAEKQRAEKAKAYTEEEKRLGDEAIARMRKRKAELEKLGDTESAHYKRIVDLLHIMNNILDDTATKTRQAFEAAGLSMNELFTGITDSEQSAIDSLQNGVNYINGLGLSAKQTGAMISRFLGGSLKELTTPEGITAAIAELEKLENKTPATVSQIDALKRKLYETNPAFKSLSDSIAKATQTEPLEKYAAAAKKAFEGGDIDKSQYEALLSDLATKTQVLADAEKTATKAKQQKTQATQADTAATKANADATQENTEAVQDNAQANALSSESAKRSSAVQMKLGKELASNTNTWKIFNKTLKEAYKVEGYYSFINAHEAAWDAVRKLRGEIQRAAAAEEILAQKVEAGTVTMADLSDVAQRAAAGIGRLDDAQLNKLNATLDKARNKIKDLKDEARQAAQSVADRLADATGSEADKINRRFEREIEDLQSKSAKSNVGSADYERAISDLRKLQQIELDKQQKREQERIDQERRRKVKEAQEAAREVRESQPAQSQPFDINAFGDKIKSREPIKIDSKQMVEDMVRMLNENEEQTIKKAITATQKDIIEQIRARNRGMGRY